MKTSFQDSTTQTLTTPQDQNDRNKQLPVERPKKGKKWAIALVAAGLLALSTGIYLVRNQSQGKQEIIETLTIPVQAQNIVVRITASGEVQPIQRVNLSPKNQGRLAELYVEQGDRVQAGQVIARMESRDLEVQLRQVQARLESAKANLAKQETGSRPEEIAAARARLNQVEARLSQLQAGSRPEEIAAARARLNQVEARLSQLQAGSRREEIAVARARLDRTQANLSQLRAGNRREEIAQGKARLEQAIARLDDATTGSLKEEIEQAKARIEATKAELELTTKRQVRYQNLASEGAIARDAYEEYVRDDRRVRANLREAEKRLEQLTQARGAEIERLTAAVEQEKQAFQLLENGTRPEEIARARAEVAEAQSQLEELENGTRPEEIARAKAEVAEAQSQLEELENGTRPEEIARAKAEVAEARSQLEELENGTRPEEIARARAEVAEMEAQVRYQEILLEDTQVRAPFSGIITQRYATKGAFVTPATSASNATSASSTSIVALARGLEVLAKVPEADIGQIKSGQSVEIVADAYPDQVFKGKVKLIAPEAIVERDVTLFEVRVALETGKEKLQSGMNVDLQFLGDRLENALVVPTVAIVTNKGETGVLIPDEKNQPKFQSVTLGFSVGNQIQILQGIKAGERVFIELPEGKKLEDIFGNR
ncbi:MAG: efflux RND transporter periplasmic adaptor subunit [Okeania sp. SIO2G4]|uniref:efflux RND transporter periplasmic adaptor subunit n=1 Tax=unclassified Okeania TaxID=2634635 RepID=UPI0013B869F4|nr:MULTISPECIES: efflux RND transporter periplasmic adaptor subunit [unclassified Okeania]NEP06333.1 efflux RND transporter periplasmic adaptor subunit [Okeania sp. SIO4D6]NEP70551.1 efflux RND transporter periplasmic adaptor subunit [Okeania sp. SIO2G5]NEP96272.1 efflux RND transporter periplasmic adaptor subunit [Okeania sp. SIO2F5]NEQ90288.1 efflux RND transporter periplasmic adaptor subunit [Okeania sp. SIO2G4]